MSEDSYWDGVGSEESRKEIWFECDTNSILTTLCRNTVSPLAVRLRQPRNCYNCNEVIEEGHHGCRGRRLCNCSCRDGGPKVLCITCYRICRSFQLLHMDVCAVEHEGKVYLVDETRKVYDIGEPEWTLKHPVGTWDEHRNKPLTSEELHRENRVSLRLEKNKFDMDTARLMGWSESDYTGQNGVPPFIMLLRVQDAVERALYNERELTKAQVSELEAWMTEKGNACKDLELLKKEMKELRGENTSLKDELVVLRQQFDTLRGQFDTLSLTQGNAQPQQVNSFVVLT